MSDRALIWCSIFIASIAATVCPWKFRREKATYFLHWVSFFEENPGDDSWHWSSDGIAIDCCLFGSLNLIKVVDSSEAVSFSIEHKELAVLFIKLNILEVSVSCDLNVWSWLEFGLDPIKGLVSDFLSGFGIRDGEIDFVDVCFCIMDQISFELLVRSILAIFLP